MIQEKRRRNTLSSAVPKYKYLVELVSLCVRHLKVGAHAATPHQLDADFPSGLNTFVTSQEADIFVPEARFLKRFVQEAKRSRSVQALCKAHVHYAHFDGDQVEDLFRTVQAGLQDNDFDGLRPYLALFEALLE